MNDPEPGELTIHSQVAHDLLGFCAADPGRSYAAETTAWHVWAEQLQGRLTRWLLKKR